METVPQNLRELLHEVLSAPVAEGSTRADVLLSVLRKHHFWPALQVKKFFDRSGLVLLHNTYKRTDVESFRALYDECRSIVLDLDAPEGENIVVTLAHSIPERLTVQQYDMMKNDTDKCELSYEGTVVTVYEHKGRWYFGTSSCPSVDSSRYFHPTKTHGQMVDEVIAKHYPHVVPVFEEGTHPKVVQRETSRALRDAFAANLDVKKAYAFLLVHHENRHVMNYASEFGEDNYKELFHINTRDRITLQEDDLTTRPLEGIGMNYAKRFTTADEAIAYARENTDVYGVIARTVAGKMYKVSDEKIVLREECDLGNPNKWQNMLWVYMQNKPHYHIDDYIKQYAPTLEFPKDSLGRDMAPTYIIHTVICTMRDILYNMYVATTSYNHHVKKFRMNRELDGSLPPVLRFHLAQLRHLQVDSHTHGTLTPKAVYHYICHHQTIKNIRTLINFFASHGGHQMKYRQAECFGVLNQLLSE
jgi:hypothetical protein